MKQDRALVEIALFAAMIAALGLLPKFTLPMGVPITAQSLGVMLAGVMLGPVRGALAVLLFLFVMALGAPILAGGRGGLGMFQTPSVGFLIGFPVAAFVCGLVMKALRAMPVFPAAVIAALVGGIGALYAFGIPGIVWKTDLTLAGATVAVAPFLVGDAIKAVATGFIAAAIAKGLPGAIRSRA